MKYIFVFLFFVAFTSNAQPFMVNGVVQSESGETVPYALVVDSINSKAVYSDINGNFQFIAEKKEIVLKFSHFSNDNIRVNLSLVRDTFLTVRLPGLEIEEVLVKGTSLAKQAMLGVNFLDSRTIQNIPSFFGEPDLVKAITVLPGISAGLDIYSGIYVRGGNRDQNLFLVDGARYYTTSHAGGLLSLFNSDMVRHVDVYKGIAPVKYGGAVSSVVDIQYTEGGDRPHLNIDIGTLRSGIFMETKGSRKLYIALAGRISYLDFITGNAFKKLDYTKVPINEETDEYTRYNFWDMDGKLVYKPSKRTAVSLNFHLGGDENATYWVGRGYISNVKDVKKNQGRGTYVTNNNMTLNLRHLFQSGLTLKNTCWFTNYQLSNQSREEIFSKGDHYSSYFFKESTFIEDISNKLEFIYPINKMHTFSIGTQVSGYKVNPQYGYVFNDRAGIDSLFGEGDAVALETSGFIEDHIALSDCVILKMGLRVSGILSPDTNYYSIEPRVQISYQISKDWALRGGFSVNSQPFHVLLQTYGYYENENWVLASRKYEPQISKQLSGGVFGKIPGTTIELSMETYYKSMENLLFLNPIAYDAKNMFNFIYANGKGCSYGLEWLLKKDNGKIQWDVAYVLSWSQRKFDELNSNHWYFSEFDRRHDLNIGLHYFSGKKNVWNLNYILQSGRPFTLPKAYVGQTSFFNGFYIVKGVNNYRMPAYKRFDLAYKRQGTIGHCKTELTLSVMNVFATKNPFNMYVKDGNLYMNSLYRVIPSLNLKFYLK